MKHPTRKMRIDVGFGDIGYEVGHEVLNLENRVQAPVSLQHRWQLEPSHGGQVHPTRNWVGQGNLRSHATVLD